MIRFIYNFGVYLLFLLPLFICSLAFAAGQTSLNNAKNKLQKDTLASSDSCKVKEFIKKYTLFRTVLMAKKREAWLRVRSSKGSQPKNVKGLQLRRVVFGDKISGWQLVGLTRNRAIFRKEGQTITLVIPKEDRPPAKIALPSQKKTSVSEQRKRQRSLQELQELIKSLSKSGGRREDNEIGMHHENKKSR